MVDLFRSLHDANQIVKKKSTVLRSAKHSGEMILEIATVARISVLMTFLGKVACLSTITGLNLKKHFTLQVATPCGTW